MGWFCSFFLLKLRLCSVHHTAHTACCCIDDHHMAGIFTGHAYETQSVNMLILIVHTWNMLPKCCILGLFIHDLVLLLVDFRGTGSFWWVHMDIEHFLIWNINQILTVPDENRTDGKWSKTDIYWNNPTPTVISWAGYLCIETNFLWFDHKYLSVKMKK